MDRMRKLQRGAADLVSVAVGLTLLAITAAGTSTAILFSRQALINQEHYKVAAYKLRGWMEYECARIQLFEYGRKAEQLLLERQLGTENLDNPLDRDGRIGVTTCRFYREPVDVIDRIENGIGDDYMRVTVHAEWTDKVAPGSMSSRRAADKVGPTHELSLTTTIILRGTI